MRRTLTTFGGVSRRSLLSLMCDHRRREYRPAVVDAPYLSQYSLQ